MGVRYFNIDYCAEQYRRGAVGPRVIVSSEEWEEPTWAHPACDSLDYAVEFNTDSGARFTASWESPREIEGLGLRKVAAVGSAVHPDAEVAVWDVSERSRWSDFIGSRVDDVTLRYQPWLPSKWWRQRRSSEMWCCRIDLKISGRSVALLLAEGEFGGDRLAPSADNVAVVFDDDLPPQH